MCEQPRREQAQPTVIGGGPPDGDGRIGDTRAIRVRRLYAFGSRGFANFEQRQHGPDQPTGRQAGQSLDGVRPDPWLVGLNETEQQIDVAAIAERGFHRQDSSNNPPIAVDQPVRESIAGRFTQSDARHMLQRRQIETGLSVKRSQIVVQHPLRLARSNGAQRFDRRLDDLGSIRAQPLRRRAHGRIAIPGEEPGGGSPDCAGRVLEAAAQIGDFRCGVSSRPVLVEDVRDGCGPSGEPAAAGRAADVEATSAASVRSRVPLRRQFAVRRQPLCEIVARRVRQADHRPLPHCGPIEAGPSAERSQTVAQNSLEPRRSDAERPS